MKTAFWLLDVNHEVKDGVGEVWLWGIEEYGRRVLLIDRSFVGYFYAVVEDAADADEIADKILKKHGNVAVKAKVVNRRFFGKPVKAVQVFCGNPDSISRLAKELRSYEGVKDCLEDDIRFAMRYMIDNDVVPCGWHTAEVVEEKDAKKAKVDGVYVVKSTPKPLEKAVSPQLRVLGFSTVYYSREGSPRADRNSVIIISVATNSGEKQQFVADNKCDDKSILGSFVKYVQDYDPDVVAGFGTNDQIWSYLLERCKKLNVRLLVDRTKTEPHTSLYGHVSVTGRANVDVADFIDEFLDIKVKTLVNFADYLGVMRIEDRPIIDEVDFADYWDDPEKRESLFEFSADNTERVMGIFREVSDFAIQLSTLVALPLDHVGTAAAGFRVEWFLIKRTHPLGELIPKRVEQPYHSYAGGLVLSPKSGLHDNIAVLDFKSMYPSLMIAYNLSPDTYVAEGDPIPEGGVYVAPEVKHRFRKKPDGFYKEVLLYLIDVRDKIRPKLKSLGRKSAEYRVLDARQKAVKILTNASYGYAGWVGARWYMKPVAEAAAAWGRDTILRATKMAEDEGLAVVYGDTDSLFVENDESKIYRLTKEVKNSLGLEIKAEKVYVRLFFTEAKKRYAGLLKDGSLDIVGLEVARGDWAAVAKNVQERVLEIVLKEESAKKAVSFMQSYVNDLRQKRVPYRDLIIWKTLSKRADEYEVKASHVEAARMLHEKGWNLGMGDKVGYVIVVGSGRLYEKAKPYQFASYDEVDLDYYVAKQIIPAAARVLDFFGTNEERLLDLVSRHAESKRLTDFFGG
jgi:DNA polymerase I